MQRYHYQDRLIDIIANMGCYDPNKTDAEIVACMKSIPAQQLIQLIPESWSTPGIWNLPKSPNGQYYAGLPVVDGVILKYPFEEALCKGVMDVPLLLGNMGQEPDIGPDLDVSNYSLEEWKQFLESYFLPWGASVGEEVYNLYKSSAEVNPQLAFDEIVSDYGITCASSFIARQALTCTSSSFQSPLYIFYNTWALSNSFTVNSGLTVRYAFHGLDLIAATSNWDKLNGYTPTQHDLYMSKSIQNLFYDFMISRGIAVEGLSPVNSLSSWPTDYNMYVISGNEGDLDVASMQMNFKQIECSYLEGANLTGKMFWWVN